MFLSQEIEIKNINHLGLVAGIIDDIGLEKIINEVVGEDPRELITSGQVVKGMILNGLGMISQPLYLFPKFFEDKPTEHLLGKEIKAEYLNDDKIGRVMDKLYEKGLSSIFLIIALSVVQNYQLLTNFSHLDSSSFSVHGKYLINNLISSKQEEKEEEKSEEPAPITITKGYSRDHRPDLKQFIIDLIVSGDGGIPLFLRVADGNEQDKVVFGEIAVEYKSMINFETMIVADSALYTAKNLQLMSSIQWLSRVPLSLGKAKELVNNVLEKELTQSSVDGYLWKEEVITYAEIKQRWLLVESQKRKESDLKKLSERIEKEKEKADKNIKSLMKDKFDSMSAAMEVANRFSQTLKYHQLTNIQVQKIEVKNKKKQIEIKYKLTTNLEINQDKVDEKKRRAGRLILATNELKESALSSDDILIKYKEQQSVERGFGFLKDPLFFADSVFLKSPKRVETMAMLMGLCLLVYSLGQRELRRRLKEAKTGLKNQLVKLTEKPTLRWIFQCFQGIHLLVQSGKKQVVNLTEERQRILSFFPLSVQNYYILSG